MSRAFISKKKLSQLQAGEDKTKTFSSQSENESKTPANVSQTITETRKEGEPNLLLFSACSRTANNKWILVDYTGKLVLPFEPLACHLKMCNTMLIPLR